VNMGHEVRKGKGSDRRANRTYRAARIPVFCALSVIGSFIHLPGPIQTVAFDSAPGFFAALYFGPLDGAAVSGIGHLATSIINGFPLGILHLPIALGLACAGAAIGSVKAKFNATLGLAVGIIINTALVVLAVPAIGWAATISFMPFLFLAACANGVAAGVAYIGVRKRLRP
jgi:riboflavin transporter